MVQKTFLDIETRDAEGYTNRLRFRIIDYVQSVGLPPTNKAEAVIAAIFGTDGTKPSNQVVTSWAFVVEETSPTSPGGNGTSATAIAARARNHLTPAVDEWMFSIPGLSKAAVTFDPRNPNSISVTGSMWAAVRTALADPAIAVGNPAPDTYEAEDITVLIESASQFNGRRGPKRPT